MVPPLISFGSVPNERYAPNAPSSSDHDNEDECLVHSDSSSVYLCVLDGHDGLNAVDFVKKYLEKYHFDISCYQSCQESITKCIEFADTKYFKSIQHFIDEKTTIQNQIPKVIYAPTLVYVILC